MVVCCTVTMIHVMLSDVLCGENERLVMLRRMECIFLIIVLKGK